MGETTDNRKSVVKRARMSEADAAELRECCQVLGLCESEIIRMGVKKVFEELKQKK